ncbi:MAG: caspase family protein [Elusimicrobiota bacterium]
MRYHLPLFLAFALLSLARPTAASEKNPSWVDRGGGAFADGVAGVGALSISDADELLTYAAVDSRARADLAKSLGIIHISALRSSIAGGKTASGPEEQMIEKIAKAFSNRELLPDIRIVGHWYDRENGAIFALAFMDTATVIKTLPAPAAEKQWQQKVLRAIQKACSEESAGNTGCPSSGTPAIPDIDASGVTAGKTAIDDLPVYYAAGITSQLPDKVMTGKVAFVSAAERLAATIGSSQARLMRNYSADDASESEIESVINSVSKSHWGTFLVKDFASVTTSSDSTREEQTVSFAASIKPPVPGAKLFAKAHADADGFSYATLVTPVSPTDAGRLAEALRSRGFAPVNLGLMKYFADSYNRSGGPAPALSSGTVTFQADGRAWDYEFGRGTLKTPQGESVFWRDWSGAWIPDETDRKFVAKPEAELKATSGKILTKLSLGTTVRIERKADKLVFVEVNKSLRGWLPADTLSPIRPDLDAPRLELTRKEFQDPELFISGRACDDTKVSVVRLNYDTLPRLAAAGDATCANAYSFELRRTLTPGEDLRIVAKDATGKTSEVPILLEQSQADYTPDYVSLRAVQEASVRKEPDPAAESIGSIRAGTLLFALGQKDGWYYLQSGGWVPQDSMERAAEAAPKKQDAAVSIEAEPELVMPETGLRNADGVAVVIGIGEYKNAPKVDFAKRDAEAMRDFLIRSLGYRPENVILLVDDPSKGDFERVFGTEAKPKGQLARLVKPSASDVFVYYSGHGAPDLKTKASYFVPYDADPNYIELNGYERDLMLRNLSSLPARSVTVVMEACFSGAFDQGLLIKEASPLVLKASELTAVPKDITLITSAASSEVSSWHAPARHSLFTYYFLKALAEAAEARKPVKYSDIMAAAKPQISYMAGRLHNREQNPQLHNDRKIDWSGAKAR